MTTMVSPTAEKLLTYENDIDRIIVALAEGSRELLRFVAYAVAGSIVFAIGMAVGVKQLEYDLAASTYVAEINPFAVGLAFVGGLLGLAGVIILCQAVSDLRGRLADLRTMARLRRDCSEFEPTVGLGRENRGHGTDTEIL